MKPSQIPILLTKTVCAPSPLTPPAVPPSYEHIVNRVRRVLQGSDEGFIVHDVPFDVYERLDARARVDANLAGWEGLRYVACCDSLAPPHHLSGLTFMMVPLSWVIQPALDMRSCRIFSIYWLVQGAPTPR
jgi:hypothetical protein